MCCEKLACEFGTFGETFWDTVDCSVFLDISGTYRLFMLPLHLVLIITISVVCFNYDSLAVPLKKNLPWKLFEAKKAHLHESLQLASQKSQ